jgi:hypothetical protein
MDAPASAASRAAPPRRPGEGEPALRAAPESAVPDVVLGLAVGAITLAPLTWGASLLLAPVAWAWAVVEIRRRRRRGERTGERLDSARTAGGFVTMCLAAPAAVLAVGVYVFLMGSF